MEQEELDNLIDDKLSDKLDNKQTNQDQIENHHYQKYTFYGHE